MKKVLKKGTLIAFYLLLFLVLATPRANAADNSISCPNRYVTFVNPVRARSLWTNPSLSAFTNQYQELKKYHFPATWLLQYDTFNDKPLINEIAAIDRNQETGIFLEISKSLADKAGVVYPINTPWYKPNAVFLSGYTQSDRKKLIDEAFQQYKSIFNTYPTAVGAWWIDSYSLNYLKQKYQIKTVMIVAPQKGTDNYTVWGQWWGIPYYPSKANILTPATSVNNKQDIVITQWAQRDPTKAFGIGPTATNYSLQANDYSSLGKSTAYFESLIHMYLDCRNKLGQITVGLETGSTSVQFATEYKNQLKLLATIKNLTPVTLSQFANKYVKIYPTYPTKWDLSYNGAEMTLTNYNFTTNQQPNAIVYAPENAFKDYFLPDTSQQLNRNLSAVSLPSTGNALWYLPWIMGIVFGVLAWKIRKVTVYISSLLFAFSAFGLIFRSYTLFGWQVFFGPVINWLDISKSLIVVLCFVAILLLSQIKIVRKNNILLLIIPLIFGFDAILQLLKYSFINGTYYVGVLGSKFTLYAISFKKPFHIGFAKMGLPAYQAGALLHVNFNKIWDNLPLALIAYPLVHLIIGAILAAVLTKLPAKVQMTIIALLMLLWLLYLSLLCSADPRKVIP